VASVSEAHAGLRGALVAAVLQVDDSLGGAELLLGELAHVLRGLLGADGGLPEVRALPAEGLETDDDAVEVLPLPEVDGLEGLRLCDAQALGVGGEGVDVLHALEGHRARLDLLHGARLQHVDQAAENLSILEDLVEVVLVAIGVDVLAENFLDPVEHLSGGLLRVLGVHLSVSLGSKPGLGGSVHGEGWYKI